MHHTHIHTHTHTCTHTHAHTHTYTHTASSIHHPTTTLQTSDITSPPQSQKTDDNVTSPPASRRRLDSPGSQGRPLFSSPPPYLPTSEIDLSSPLTYGTPSSRIVGTPGRSQGTPIRPRSDIGSMRRLREVNLAATDPPVRSYACYRPDIGPHPPAVLLTNTHMHTHIHTNAPYSHAYIHTQTGDPTSTGVTSEGAPEAHLVIWGTDVNVQEAKKKFRDFLENFVNDIPEEGGDLSIADQTEPYYMQRLEEVDYIIITSPLHPYSTLMHEFSRFSYANGIILRRYCASD